jgi:hypothetical protein
VVAIIGTEEEEREKKSMSENNIPSNSTELFETTSDNQK